MMLKLQVIETHPHADFVSSHLELRNSQAASSSQMKFYLAAKNKDHLQRMMGRTAAIGYVTAITATFIIKEARIDLDKFKKHKDNYTIVDVRNTSEVKGGKIFPGSLPIPLGELRNCIDEISAAKPIVVHCAG